MKEEHCPHLGGRAKRGGMQQVTIKYQPIRWLRFNRTAKGNLPETWEEVTPRQIVAIACTANNSISDIAFLAAMTGIRKRIIKKLSDFQRFCITEALTFFEVETMYNGFVIQQFKVKGIEYTTPKQKLKGMTFGQFIFVDTLFGIYMNDHKPADLHQFLAALCIPSGEKFNEENMEPHSHILAKAKPELKEALIINYQLVKAWLQKTYPLIFPEVEEPEDQQHSNTAKRPYDSSGWIKIFESIVGDSIIDRDKYAALPIHDTFRYLSRKIRENIKRKK